MNNQEFKYTYTAPTEAQRREIESIRKQYMPREDKESKLEKIKRLDGKVKNPPQIVSLALGIIGILIFGLGLTCALEWNIMALCIILSIIGIGLVISAYPMYNYILSKNKAKYAEEIIQLSKDVLGE